MEEYVTRREFDRLLKEEVRKQLKEQKTEEMKAIRVDVHNVDVEAIKQELKTVSDTWLETLQEHYTEHKADFLKLQESQADFRDKLIEQGTKLDRMENSLSRIVGFLEKQGME